MNDNHKDSEGNSSDDGSRRAAGIAEDDFNGNHGGAEARRETATVMSHAEIAENVKNVNM